MAGVGQQPPRPSTVRCPGPPARLAAAAGGDSGGIGRGARRWPPAHRAVCGRCRRSRGRPLPPGRPAQHLPGQLAHGLPGQLGHRAVGRLALVGLGRQQPPRRAVEQPELHLEVGAPCARPGRPPGGASPTALPAAVQQAASSQGSFAPAAIRRALVWLASTVVPVNMASPRTTAASSAGRPAGTLPTTLQRQHRHGVAVGRPADAASGHQAGPGPGGQAATSARQNRSARSSLFLPDPAERAFSAAQRAHCRSTS